MGQTEITVQVFSKDSEELVRKLKHNNFELVDQYRLVDYYFSKYNNTTLQNMSYADIIKNSFLVRECNGDVSIVYKSKEIDKDNNVISETKKRFKIADNIVAKEVFLNAGLNNWCNLVQDIYCYKNKEMEIMVQYVDDLGVFIEYEEDTSVEHLETKQKVKVMVKKLKSIGLAIGTDFSVKKVYEKFIKNSRHDLNK